MSLNRTTRGSTSRSKTGQFPPFPLSLPLQATEPRPPETGSFAKRTRSKRSCTCIAIRRASLLGGIRSVPAAISGSPSRRPDLFLRVVPDAESLEGDQPRKTERTRHPLCAKKKRRRDSLSCALTAKTPAADATLGSRSERPLHGQQDLGNTNYCVFVPRIEFDRKTNAELVVRGLQKLDLAAYVNERNDICVDGFKMSSLSPFAPRFWDTVPSPLVSPEKKRDADEFSSSCVAVATSRDRRSSWSTSGRTTTGRC